MQPAHSFLETSIPMKRLFITAVTALLCCLGAHAQKVAIQTNAIDWAFLLTPNIGLQYAVSQHFSIEAQAKVNAWSFRTSGTEEERMHNEIKSRQQAYALGARWWPWNVYSGWWVGAKIQFQQYDNGGLKALAWLPDNEAGNAYGGGLSAGYSLQLHKHWNMDFGLGLWGGYKTYTVYSCPWCGKTVDKGAKTFILPDQAMISLMYIF